MKTITISLALFMASFFYCQLQAQNTFYLDMGYNKTSDYEGDIQKKIEQLEQQKAEIEKVEKDKLRVEVEEINKRLKNNEITAVKADELKKAAAEKRALNIENQLDILDANVALLKRNMKELEGGDKKIDSYYTSLEFLKFKERKEKQVNYDSIPKRTTSGFTMALGLNNVLIEGQSLDDSPYKIGGSRFLELGYEFETVLVKSGFARLRYGVSFQFNGLKADDNMYFVEDGNQTYLEKFPFNVDKAKLRMDNLVIPLHFEFGPRSLTYGKKATYYNTSNFKIGLGGYAGVNLNTIQKLKYEEDGNNRKTKLSQSYNTSNFIYGVSAYIGYDWWALYAKYDLNTVFKDNTLDQNNISVGIRFSN